jgi:diketogulonate reductase-like aldo/keto reductase
VQLATPVLPKYDCAITATSASGVCNGPTHCWTMQEEADGEDKEEHCFYSWATTPMQFKTSSPKLDYLTVKANSITCKALHIQDHSQIQRGLTSFYSPICMDDLVSKPIYFGTTSKMFVWFWEGLWRFSNDFIGDRYKNGSIECLGNDMSLEFSSCVTLPTKAARRLVVTVSDADADAHKSLIQLRNKSRKCLHRVLLNGLIVPVFGLGTGMLDPEQSKVSVRLAIDLGYELIDTAAIYGNEKEIGDVLVSQTTLDWPLIETKIWPTELGYKRTIHSLMSSRTKLRQPVLDIAILHWPRCYVEWNVDWMDCSSADEDNGELWLESWRAMERLYAEGLILAIGLSNFDDYLVEQALLKSRSVPPMLLQNYFSLENLDENVVRLCEHLGIYYQAYSLFREVPGLAIQQKLTTAMEMSNWQLDQMAFTMKLALNAGVGFIVRSQSAIHLKENLQRIEEINDLVMTDSVFDIFKKDKSDEL